MRVTHYDYLLFYKPKGCVTTLNEDKDNKSGRKKTDAELEEIKNRAEKLAKQGIVEEQKEYSKPRKIITDYIGEDYKNKRLYPVGRLDYDSEGLLLLTNDGNLTYKLTHPSSEIPKTYIVKIEGTIDESDLATLRKGVTVDGVKYGRSKVKVTGIEKVGESKKQPLIQRYSCKRGYRDVRRYEQRLYPPRSDNFRGQKQRNSPYVRGGRKESGFLKARRYRRTSTRRTCARCVQTAQRYGSGISFGFVRQNSINRGRI